MTGTGNTRVGIIHGRDNPGDTGMDQCLGTGLRLALMGAGFEGHIGGGIAGSFAGGGKGTGFGVGAAAPSCPASANDGIILDENASHSRIGPGPTALAAADGKGMIHVA